MDTTLLLLCIPFAGLILSIAIFPVVKGEWWEAHQGLIVAAWVVLFLVPYIVIVGIGETAWEVAEVLIVDFVPFIVLLFGLFAVAGGIWIRGTVAGTTKNNVILLAIGMALASFIGTTGAAMVLIRPVLRANSWRRKKAHVVVFFIFLVANIGGCLTPLGDPPLFLGFLRGVPFAWTLVQLWPMWLFNGAILLVVFALIDRHFAKQEGKEGREALALEEEATEHVPIRIQGAHNIAFLALIIVAVLANGIIPQTEAFINPETGTTYGITVGDMHLGIEYFVQIILILVAVAGSLITTKKETREGNEFSWAPIQEVARLFVGIFITMIPALALLRANGGALGIDQPWECFWITGSLSSFLDNSPTYLVFLTSVASAGVADPTGAGMITTTVGSLPVSCLAAISAGAVFMGANTYVGNAPNFMVKSIAEESQVKMPSFFGYMGWSLAILIPLFLVDTVVFFLL